MEKIELKEFVGKPCRSGTAFEFLPKKIQKLDLQKIAKKLKEHNVLVEAETPYLIILVLGGKSVSLFQSGKIMVKSTKEQDIATEIAEKLLSIF